MIDCLLSLTHEVGCVYIANNLLVQQELVFTEIGALFTMNEPTTFSLYCPLQREHP